MSISHIALIVDMVHYIVAPKTTHLPPRSPITDYVFCLTAETVTYQVIRSIARSVSHELQPLLPRSLPPCRPSELPWQAPASGQLTHSQRYKKEVLDRSWQFRHKRSPLQTTLQPSVTLPDKRWLINRGATDTRWTHPSQRLDTEQSLFDLRLAFSPHPITSRRQTHPLSVSIMCFGSFMCHILQTSSTFSTHSTTDPVPSSKGINLRSNLQSIVYTEIACIRVNHALRPYIMND